MWGAFVSEWVKLRRRNLLLWGFGGGLFFPILGTIVTIENATRTLQFNPGGRHGFHVLYSVLEQPNGLVHGVTDVSFLIGIVSLCLFAAAFATEYSQGTLRNLLVREPRRMQLLSGKFLALVLFILIVVVVAVGASVAVAFALAPGKGITTTAWTSSTGVNDLFQAVLHAFIAAVIYGLFGGAIGVLVRSPGVAIGSAVAWIVAIERIVTGLIWSNGDRWLPGQLLFSLAQGGGVNDSSYHHALVVLVVYAVIVAAGTLLLFQRRDA
ncbi:MAG: ABC transporter permease [Solirubrobacteraceae bacterium]|jgi:ABC-type transport system involved in multi-copper enzyme maturation permease subunit